MKLRLLSREVADPGSAPAVDASAILALKAGSVEALGRFYDAHHQRVRVLASRLLGDDAAAEDVVQDVFSALPRALGHFRGEADVLSFLLGIAVKKSRTHLRGTIRRRRLIERYAMTDGVPTRDPEHDAYRRELAHRLVWALDHLSFVRREAFVLCDVDGMPAAQAGAVLGIAEATVRTRLFHARARLKVLLADEAIR
jgi:RNA polymerase sigma-70 factor, ECF subfamily